MPNSWMQPQHQQQQQQTTTAGDDARFKESKTLRSLIDERLEEQQQCLDLAVASLESLRELAQYGEASPGKGPGDEHIPASTVANLEKTPASPFNQMYGGDIMQQMNAMSPYGAGQRGYGSRLAMMPGPAAMLKSPEKEKDPLGRYYYVEDEIFALMCQATARHSNSNSQLSMAQILANEAAETAAALADPKKATDDKLAKLLGPADGSGKLENAVIRGGNMLGGAGSHPVSQVQQMGQMQPPMQQPPPPVIDSGMMAQMMGGGPNG